MGYSDPQLVHLDKALTQISAGFENAADYSAKDLAPTIPVDKQSDKYWVHNRDTWGRVTDDIRAPGSHANELPPMTLSTSSYFAEEHALVGLVPVEDVNNQDAGLDSMGDTTEEVTNTILLNREAAMVTLFTTVANYASGFSSTLSGTSQWNDYTNSDPIGVMKTAVDAIFGTIFKLPNTIVAGWQVARKLEDHTKLIDRIKYTVGAGVSTDSILAELFGVQSFRRAMGGKLTSAYLAAETVGYIWPKDVVLAYVNPNPGKKRSTFAYEFVQKLPELGNQIMPTERWWDIDKKTWKIRVTRRYDVKFITADSTGDSAGAGYLIKDAIA